MLELPPELISRLPLPQTQLLRRALTVVADELPVVYAANVRDHRPRDNAQVFGLRGFVHIWAGLRERDGELGEARVVEDNNTFFLRVGELKVGIHKLGDVVDDDIHSCFPERSATQRSYGQRNALQLTLFESAPEAPLPEERAYALRELTVGHFGNPRDGLVKWYVGAYIYDDQGRPRWAWVALQHVEQATSRPEVTPYSERPPAAVEVNPRPKRERPAAVRNLGA